MSETSGRPIRFAHCAIAFVILASYLVPAGLIFGPALSSEMRFACRDASHYYPPLYETIHRQWRGGELPVWNPLEERGRPLLADPTATVFYPGQLIFHLPIPFATRFKLYVLGHVALAFATMFYTSKRLCCRPSVAALAAVSYAFGGNVVFQHANPPYLVGAAWLPLGIHAVVTIFTKSTVRSYSILGLVLSMLVLGGDPETAYLLGLASVLACVIAVHIVARHNSDFRLAIRAGWRCIVRLLLTGLLAAAITAAQWMPTVAWARRSERVLPISVASDAPASSELAGSLEAVESVPHSTKRYWFSIGPWRWAELLWPNASGKPFPRNSRWISVIPAEGRFWSPTLYMGLVPFLLALRMMRLTRGTFVDRWLTWLITLAVLGSLGRFGFGWLIRELSTGRIAWGSGETGGLYWLLVNGCPGFATFRYPAKLWVGVAVAVSLLAARRLEVSCQQRRRPIPSHWLDLYLAMTTFGVLVMFVFRQDLLNWLSAAPSRDAIFGPLQPQLAIHGLLSSGIHGIAIAIAVRSIQTITKNSGTIFGSQRRALLLLSLTVMDISVGNQWLAPVVPATNHSRHPIAMGSGELVLRSTSDRWYPRSWRQTSDTLRYAECAEWDRQTGKPKLGQSEGIRSLRSATSFSSANQIGLLTLLSSTRRESPKQFMRIIRRLGTHWYIEPAAHEHPSGWPNRYVNNRDDPRFDVGSAGFTLDDEAAFVPIDEPFPSVWLSARATWQTSTASTRLGKPLDLVELTKAAFRPTQSDDRFRDTVVIEATPAEWHKAKRVHALVTTEDKPASIVRGRAHSASEEPGAYCRLRERTNSRIVIESKSESAAWIVLNEMFDPGWTAKSVTIGEGAVATLPVLMGNRVMCAVPVPAGRHVVEFRYRAPGLIAGTLFSGLTLTLLAGVLLRSASCPRFRR